MRYTPGTINDVAVVLDNGDFATAEDICLKLNDYEELLLLIKKFDEQMATLNTTTDYENLWYQLPQSLVDLWRDADVVIRGIDSQYRLTGMP